jgi:alpha,alpha-trehalase
MIFTQEDTDNDKRLPKMILAQKICFSGWKTKTETVVQGTYHLSNLLQELAVHKEKNGSCADRFGTNTRRAGRSNFKKKLEKIIGMNLHELSIRKAWPKFYKTKRQRAKSQLCTKDKLGITYFQDLEKSLKF